MNGQCTPLAAQTATSCGARGQTCAACPGGRSCVAGSCFTEACLILYPADLDFGQVQATCRSSLQPVEVLNRCTTALDVTSVSLAGGSGFVFTSTAAFPLSVAPGASVVVGTVSFQPTAQGSASDTLTAAWAMNMASQTAVQTPIKARGGPSGANVETYSVPTQVDVVMVIDNSGSMQDKQTTLQAAASQLLTYPTSTSVDFKLAFTTTDNDPGGEQGLFITNASGSSVLRPTTPMLTTQFSQSVNRGINGSGTEMTFEPMLNAFQRPENAGFLRPGAGLSFFGFTDEIEQSPHSAPFYVKRLLALVGHRARNRVGYFAMTPPPTFASCSNDTNDPRQAVMTSLTGGQQWSICDMAAPTWLASTPRLIGEQLFGRRRVWFLNGKPAASVAVTVNGFTVPTSLYSYDAGRNAVVFVDNALPVAGDVVTFSYSVGCMP